MFRLILLFINFVSNPSHADQGLNITCLNMKSILGRKYEPLQFKLVSSLGATEAYPFTGSSEIITDITSSGETLRANNLRILKDGEILKSEACMMASKSSLKNGLVKKLVKLLSK